MAKHTIFVNNDEWQLLEIPDGWSVVKDGVVKLGDKLWYRDTQAFEDSDRFKYQLGLKANEFYCCIRLIGDACCKEFGEFRLNDKTDGFKFCPFCGKEIKKEV